jgi:DNA-binding NarL/FixJ family response regulator
MQNPPIRILLADDHQLFMDGLHSLLDELPGYVVVAKVADGAEVFSILARASVDCVLLDIQMPKMNGIEVTKLIKRDFPHVRILAVTMDSNYETVKAVLRAGADGYLVKNLGKIELAKALETVSQGQIYVSPELATVVLYGIAKRKAPIFSHQESLTKREKDVLFLIIDGLTNDQIGNKLFLSPLTVKTHRANMLSKFNCPNTAALVKYALENKLLDTPFNC